MTDAIRFINTTTFWAGSGSIPWIHQDHRNACSFRFVFNKLPELVERPVVMSRSLLAANRSLADPAQIFQSNGPTSVLRVLDETLADCVIDVLLKTLLLTGQFLQFTFGGLGLFLLQISSAMVQDASVSVNIQPAEMFPVTVGGEVDDPKIHTDHTFHINGLRCLHIAGCKQVELPFDKAQVTFHTLTNQQFHLPLTTSKTNALTARNGPDGYLHALKIIRQDAIVKCDGSLGFENAHHFSINLICIRDFGNTAHNHLGCEWIVCSDILVGKFVERELTKRSMFPSLLTDVVTGGIGGFKCLLECFCLVGVGQELDLGNQFHAAIVAQMFYCFNILKNENSIRL